MNAPLVLSKSLHKQAAEQARRLGLSVEKYLASMIESTVNGESVEAWIKRMHPDSLLLKE